MASIFSSSLELIQQIFFVGVCNFFVMHYFFLRSKFKFKCESNIFWVRLCNFYFLFVLGPSFFLRGSLVQPKINIISEMPCQNLSQHTSQLDKYTCTCGSALFLGRASKKEKKKKLSSWFQGKVNFLWKFDFKALLWQSLIYKKLYSSHKLSEYLGYEILCCLR